MSRRKLKLFVQNIYNLFILKSLLASRDTKLKIFDFYLKQLSKLILPSKDVQISLSCGPGYPEILYSSEDNFAKDTFAEDEIYLPE